MIHIVIFSKDRACQLDLLSQSMLKYIDAKQYENTLITDIGSDFEKATKAAINKDYEYTMFLPDDCMFIRKLDFSFIDKVFEEDINCFSLRLGITIMYDLPLSINLKMLYTRNIGDNIYLCEWGSNKGYFGYPMSVDGHIFRTKEISEKVSGLSFINPNQFETLLSRNPIDRPFMAFNDKQSLVNIAMNRVQETHKNNKAGDFTVKYLQARFDLGHRLDLDEMINSVKNANSCHVIPQKLYWKVKE